MKDIRAVLYDTQWQALRMRLKGNWRDTDSCAYNLSRLQAYLERAEDEQEQYFRLLRIINLLNALRMGMSGMGRIESAEALMVESFRLPLQDLRDEVAKKYPTDQLPEWDWELQRVRARKLKEVDRTLFQKVLGDLQGRLEKNGAQYRQELAQYVAILREVLREL